MAHNFRYLSAGLVRRISWRQQKRTADVDILPRLKARDFSYYADGSSR
jgi:hypothetical protein